MKNTISKMKNALGIKSRLDEAEDQISKLENKVEGNTSQSKNEKRLQNK